MDHYNFHLFFNLYFSFILHSLTVYLSIMCHTILLPLSLSLLLAPLRSLQADCFLIGGVPEVVVVMVTCKGALRRFRRWR